MEVSISSRATFSLRMIASSKLYPYQGMKATSIFLPKERRPLSIEGPSEMIVPASTFSPIDTVGRWFMHVSWLLRLNLFK